MEINHVQYRMIKVDKKSRKVVDASMWHWDQSYVIEYRFRFPLTIEEKRKFVVRLERKKRSCSEIMNSV